MIGKWDGWQFSAQIQLGDIESYEKAIAWLDGHGEIVDVGGGTGFASRFVTQSTYRVIDGSRSRFCDHPVNLETATIDADCVLLRHVLEHNHNWPMILHNVVNGFRVRAAIVTFMPFMRRTTLSHHESQFIGSIGQPVPVLHLGEPELLAVINPYLVLRERTTSNYCEEIFYLEK